MFGTRDVLIHFFPIWYNFYVSQFLCYTKFRYQKIICITQKWKKDHIWSRPNRNNRHFKVKCALGQLQSWSDTFPDASIGTSLFGTHLEGLPLCHTASSLYAPRRSPPSSPAICSILLHTLMLTNVVDVEVICLYRLNSKCDSTVPWLISQTESAVCLLAGIVGYQQFWTTWSPYVYTTLLRP